MTSLMTPPVGIPAEERHLAVRAEYYTGQLNLKLFRSRHPHYPVLASDPLVIEPERDCFAVLTKFGGVTLWNCSEEVSRELLREIGELPGSLERAADIGDTLSVTVNAPQEKVTFSEVCLRELTLEKLKIVSRAFSQSLALDRFEIEVMEALRKFEPVVQALCERGRLLLREKEVLRAVGFALEVRSAVLANLTLFDDPPETWENEEVARLHSLLTGHFDLREREEAISQKIGYLTDLNNTLLDVLSNNKSHRLEWIIIILIAIEIVFLLLMEM